MTGSRRATIAAVFLCFVVGAPAFADTVNTTIGQGIGTHVADVFGDGSNVAIDTWITSVTYADPKLVHRNGMTYYEVLGSVQGRGWGGAADTLDAPGPTFDAETHYDYNVPFVLRFRSSFNGTLLFYAHGYPNLGLSLFLESIAGSSNEARHIDELESLYVADAALTGDRSHALFAANLGGLRRDGGFAATALEGPFVGQSLNLALDVPIARDLALVAKRLLALLSGTPVSRTIGVGHSGGALIMQWTTGGVSTPVFGGPHFNTRVFTGGNFVNAYVPASGRIFDGVIPIAPGRALVHPAFPATAPIIMLAGEADYAAVDGVLSAFRILAAGIDINQVLRIYQISNLPHNFAEIFEPFPVTNDILFGGDPPADSDHLTPVVAAAIDNLVAWIADGTPPPLSRVNGVAIDADHNNTVEAIQFPQAGGLTTSIVPFDQDPAIDSVLFDQFELSAAGGNPNNTIRYAAVLAALSHVAGSIALPNAACRIGGYDFVDGAILHPFIDLAVRWPKFEAYRTCVTKTQKGLDADRLYDNKLGDIVFTPDILGLFAK